MPDAPLAQPLGHTCDRRRRARKGQSAVVYAQPVAVRVALSRLDEQLRNRAVHRSSDARAVDVLDDAVDELGGRRVVELAGVTKLQQGRHRVLVGEQP